MIDLEKEQLKIKIVDRDFYLLREDGTVFLQDLLKPFNPLIVSEFVDSLQEMFKKQNIQMSGKSIIPGLQIKNSQW